MKFLNCPHCNTDRVLAMSDGRCPNCKGMLVASDEDISAEEQLIDLLNCPHCGTKRVLTMPDGRCPNCRGMLIESGETPNKNGQESTDKRSPEMSNLGDEQLNGIATGKACKELKKPDSANNLGRHKPVTVPGEGKNCPYCNTEGVLVMSDGRCPNCKQPLTVYRTEKGATKQPVIGTNAGYTAEGEYPNRWLIFSITALFAFVQAHAGYWGGLKMGVWNDALSTDMFNWFFNICMVILAYIIVICCIKHSQKLARKKVRTYQAHSLLNGVAFSIIVAFYVPMIAMIIPIVIRMRDIFGSPSRPGALMLHLLTASYLFVIGFVILYMPALRRKRTISYRIYLCVLSILSLYFFVVTVRVYVSTDYYSALVAFLAEVPEAILHTNGFQFLPIQDFVPAMFNDIIKLFILPATAIYSIFWKESS